METRMVDISQSQFDWKYYLRVYPDLASSGIKTREQAIRHFREHGIRELRIANKLDWNFFKPLGYRVGQELRGLDNIRVLVSSLDYPSYGGAATNAYQITKYLRGRGINCAGLFFNQRIDVPYNPEQLAGIFISPVHTSIEHHLVLRDKIIRYLNGEPNYCFGKNYVAPLYCKYLFPKSYVIYLVSGINHFHQHYVRQQISIKKILDSNFTIQETIPLEETCISKVDLVILNSQWTKKLFHRIYPDSYPKTYPYVINTSYLSIINNAPIVSQKRYDIAICCSNLDRPDKNNQFSLNLLQKNFLSHKKIIIGAEEKLLSSGFQIPNTTYVGLVTHQQCLDYLGQSRVLLYPSLFDSNPSTIVEAFFCKCIPIMSANIGNCQQYPEYIVCQTFQESEWIQKINFSFRIAHSPKGYPSSYADDDRIAREFKVLDSWRPSLTQEGQDKAICTKTDRSRRSPHIGSQTTDPGAARTQD